MAESGFNYFIAYMQERNKPKELKLAPASRLAPLCSFNRPVPAMPTSLVSIAERVEHSHQAKPSSVPIRLSPPSADDYNGSFCLLHKLTAKHPTYREVLVDIDDFEFLVRHEWRLTLIGRPRDIRVVRNDEKYLAVLLIQPPDGMVADHRNHRPLDNRRKNLRPLTFRDNSINRVRGRRGTSKYKGLSWNKRAGKWYVQAGPKHKPVWLGSFHDEIEAALAYNEFAERVYGDLACLNEIDGYTSGSPAKLPSRAHRTTARREV